MKTLVKIFLKSISCLILIFMLNGCSDFLVRDHPTAITDEDFWNTTEEAVEALNSCIRRPGGTYHYTEPYVAIVHMEGMSDNMYHAANFREEITNIGNGSVLPTTGGYVKWVWEEYYKMIRRCNRLLANIHRPYFADEKERARITAEARIWRAWYHQLLLFYYGGQDGIPIVDNVLNPDEIYRDRSSVEDCLAFLNKEYDEIIASDDLGAFVWDEGQRNRMSGSIALALQMQLNLQYKKYDKAKEAALKIINSQKFELYYSSAEDDDPGKNYRDMFRYVGRTNKERILFTSKGLEEFWFRTMGTVLGGQATSCPLKSLIDTYETIEGKTIQSLSAAEKEAYEKNPLYKPRDPRLFASIMLPGDDKSVPDYKYDPFNSDVDNSDAIGKPGASRSGFLLKKFMDLQDRSSRFGSLDFVIIRYAEVLLSYVECLVESNDWQNPDVEKYITMIRRRANMPAMDKTVYNTQEKVRELYRRERRVELAFEGVRYHDIHRWNIGEQAMKGRAEGAYNPDTRSYVVVEERMFVAPKNNAWPLPQEELTSNPNIKQPTGWGL